MMFGILGAHSTPAQAEISSYKVRAYMLTSTYGVMAGTLVGIASLTFYEDASANLKNVAIGASLGLYTGIILGFYITSFSGGKDSPRGPSPGDSDPDADNPLNLSESKQDQEALFLARAQNRTQSRDLTGVQWAPLLGLSPDGHFELGVSLAF